MSRKSRFLPAGRLIVSAALALLLAVLLCVPAMASDGVLEVSFALDKEVQEGTAVKDAFAVSLSENYSVLSSQWTFSDGTGIPDGDVFQTGQTYLLTIRFTMNGSNTLYPMATASIGDDAAILDATSGTPTVLYWVRLDDTPREITGVSLTLYPEPEAGLASGDTFLSGGNGNCAVWSAGWCHENHSALEPSEAFESGETYYLELTLEAFPGYTFSGATSVSVNGYTATVLNSYAGYLALEYSVEAGGSELTAPTVTKDPTIESPREGETATFVAKADDAEKCEWVFVDPTGKEMDAAEAQKTLKGLEISGEDTERLELAKVPAAMDEWKVLCRFTNEAGTTDSEMAPIYVEKAEASPSPSASPTATASPSPSAQVSPSPAVSDAHTHHFAEVWSSDENGHWHECSCGAKTDEEGHSYEWTTDARGNRKAVCKECGYELISNGSTAEETEKKGGGAVVLVLVMALVIAGCVVGYLYFKKRQQQNSSDAGETAPRHTKK